MTRQVLLASATALIAAACANAPFASPQTARAQASKLDAKTQGYVDQMLAYSFRIRTGHYEAAAEAVKTMEAATAADPSNAELQAQLGNAYLLQATALSQTSANPMDAFALMGKGYAAQEKALAINPDNLVALGGHGSTATIYSLIRQKPELGQQGLAEMNRAVALAPKSQALVQHLLRVQTTMNLPANMRDHALEKADLDYVIARSEGTRQGDFIRVISGDISIEAGKPDQARAQYAAAAKSPRPGGDLARKRLAALDAGGVPPTDIAQLRKDTGACTACHGT